MPASCLLFKRSCWFPVVNAGNATGVKGETGGEKQNKLGSLFHPDSRWDIQLFYPGTGAGGLHSDVAKELHPSSKAAAPCSGTWEVGQPRSTAGRRSGVPWLEEGEGSHGWKKEQAPVLGGRGAQVVRGHAAGSPRWATGGRVIYIGSEEASARLFLPLTASWARF